MTRISPEKAFGLAIAEVKSGDGVAGFRLGGLFFETDGLALAVEFDDAVEDVVAQYFS